MLIVGSICKKGASFFMYKRDNLGWINKGKKSGRVGLILAAVFMMTVAIGIYTYAEIIAFAAPEETTVEVDMQEQKEEQNDLESKLAEEKPDVPLIVIDAGHGGEDIGCLGEGVFEKDINLQISLLVKSKLEERGFKVMMPRETDEYLSKEDRVELANSYQADAYISIHQNTYEGRDKSVSGIETWYDGADNTRDNERLARLVHQETIKSTGANERELWDMSELYVTRRTLMPSCLIETGFLTNPEEGRLLCSPEYQEKVAEGIAEGIDLYFHPETEKRIADTVS